MQLAPEANLDSFIAGPNAEALAACTGWADGAGEPFALVCGFPGAGKTHLLQAACQAALAAGHPADTCPCASPG